METKTMKLAMPAIGTPIILFAAVAYVLAAQVPAVPVHLHANFAVFVDGTQVNFAKPEFMNLKPCKEDDDPSLHANKRDNVHLHDLIGNVVHVHDSGLMWNDLFQNLKFNLDDESKKASLKGNIYLNGNKVDEDILTKTINKNDKLLITLSREDLPGQVTGNALLEAQMVQVGDTAKEYDQPGKSGESCSGTGKRSFQTRLKIALKRLTK